MARSMDPQSHELLDETARLLREIGGADRVPRQSLHPNGAPDWLASRRGGLRHRMFPALELLIGGLGRNQVGEMPPVPPTFRAKVGAVLVRVMRRALFWYSAQILTFQQLVVRAADEQMRVLQHLLLGQQQNKNEIAEVTDKLTSLAAEIERRDRELSLRLDRLVEAQRRQQQALDEMQAELEETANKAARNVVQNIVGQRSARIPALANEIETRTPATNKLPPVGRSGLEHLNFAHAGRFRGAQAEIKERLRVYLPHAAHAAASAGGASVLDLGCGRGEWLELLREESIAAEGVDVSPEMVQSCLELGLKVHKAGILPFLQETPDRSYSMVTAFHVVEHLEFDVLIEVLVHIARVLKPAGVAIFETPNPRNLLVMSRGFYMDPTHVRPLPSQLLSFAAETAGLSELETLFLHPYPDSYRLNDGSDASKFINEVFFGPQDYALIVKKA